MISKTNSPSMHSRLRKHSIAELFEPLTDLATESERLFPAHLEFTDPRGSTTSIPRFLFTGPGERSTFLRVGIFAGIHGDEVSGIHATVELLRRLHENPDPVTGYELFVYPVCNPWGFSQNTRWLKSGADMNREFWRGSNEVEVLLLEGQLKRLAFDGIIALHTDDTSHGLPAAQLHPARVPANPLGLRRDGASAAALARPDAQNPHWRLGHRHASILHPRPPKTFPRRRGRASPTL